MKMIYRARVLQISAWLALLTIFIIPGKVINSGPARTEYGFPVRFFTKYYNHEDMDRWLINDVSIQLLYYFVDFVIIYFFIIGLLVLINKFRGNGANK